MPFIPDAAPTPSKGRFVPDEEDDGSHGMLGKEWENNPITETIGEAAYNLPSSAINLIGSTVSAIANPIDTAKGLYELGPSGIAQFYKDRYGSIAAGVETFKKDPAGVFADLSTVATLGGGVAARAPGMAGQLAATATKVGAVTDPLTLTLRAAGKTKPAFKAAGQGLKKGSASFVGATTGAGQRSIEAAGAAGMKGGTASTDFTNQLRNKTPTNAVDKAKSAFFNIIQNRSLEFAKDMAPIYADRTILSKTNKAGRIIFPKVDTAIREARKEGTHVPPYPGRPGVTFLTSEAKVIDDIEGIVNKWRDRGQAYHTMGGFNDMKREVAEFVTKFDKGTTERRAADKIYNSIKKSVIDISPNAYKGALKQYDEASDLVRELEKTFRLSDKATEDSALRALQSTLRDNAHTTYGVRAKLLEVLQKNGAGNLVEELAGHSLRAGLRPGMGFQLAAPTLLASVGAGVLSSKALIALALYSPRVMGEISHGLGKVAGATKRGVRQGIVRPILYAERAMRKAGVNPRGQTAKATAQAAGKVAVQAGRLEDANAEKQKARAAIMAKARSMNVSIRGNVIDDLVDDLFADDPEAYILGIQRLSKNERLLELIKAAGE